MNEREKAVAFIKENSRRLQQLKKEEINGKDQKWDLREKNGRAFILHTTGREGVDGFQVFYPEAGSYVSESLDNFNNY